MTDKILVVPRRTGLCEACVVIRHDVTSHIDGTTWPPLQICDACFDEYGIGAVVTSARRYRRMHGPPVDSPARLGVDPCDPRNPSDAARDLGIGDGWRHLVDFTGADQLSIERRDWRSSSEAAKVVCVAIVALLLFPRNAWERVIGREPVWTADIDLTRRIYRWINEYLTSPARVGRGRG